jgi:methionine sulfoxide reductase catalytic subunit
MLIKKADDIRSSEITPEGLYHNRREFLKAASTVIGASAFGVMLPGCVEAAVQQQPALKKSKYDVTEKLTPYEDVTGYNNYYEFGTDKEDPVHNPATRSFKTTPWTVEVTGMVKKPTKYALDDLLKGVVMEDRIYRMRCVEGWSMVIPWHGFPLSTLIKRLEPLPSAKFIEFKTLLDPVRMPEQRSPILHWPYTEGLRMDEAMNELTLMAVGVYGKAGPVQNGAPIRLVTPWKYGFKGVKAIVKINFTDKMPVSAWMEASPREYGFYANVNPDVDHPRWSQQTERRLGEFFKRKTLPFNGYGEYVASMYSGLDLKKNF